MAESNRAAIVVRNGTIYDGKGGTPYVADVVIDGNRIVAVEPNSPRQGVQEIDAKGKIVTPGFVDVHTHYDGQAIWSKNLAPSSVHGVTTVVMGNCGVGFAPCRAEDRDLLVHVMEGVEDIPEIVMTKGLTWEWETFPEFLAALERRPHDIDVLAYIPHSALRVYVMGERGAARQPATEADLARMSQLVEEAIEAGAAGFSTSSVPVHRTRDGDHIPSFDAAEKELFAIAEGARRAKRGVLQILVNLAEAPERKIQLLADLSKKSGLTSTFTLVQTDTNPHDWKLVLAMLDKVNADPGVNVKAQIFARPIGMILNHDLTLTPFRLCPSYQAIAHLPLAEKLKELRKPELRAKLLAEKPTDATQPLFERARAWERMFEMGETPDYEPSPDQSIAARAKRLGVTPEELAYDLLLKNDGKTLLLLAMSNFPEHNLNAVHEMLHHPHCIPGLGDGGAHYGMICDSSYPTFILTHWVRDRKGPRLGLAQAVASLTRRPAMAMGLEDRGLIAPGYRADVNVIDHEHLRLHLPQIKYDLPGGGRRLLQTASGYIATIANGTVITRHDTPSGALPGKLVRGVTRAEATAA